MGLTRYSNLSCEVKPENEYLELKMEHTSISRFGEETIKIPVIGPNLIFFFFDLNLTLDGGSGYRSYSLYLLHKT